jgi:putative pyruvate formate lyase activating enzyme
MENVLHMLEKCELCPRQCRVNRLKGQKGYCKAGDKVIIAHYGPHHGEEPPISGTHGSGTIFFSFCNLRCIFCQNYQISQNGMGEEMSLGKLAEIFLELQTHGCHNINLVSPISYIPHIAIAITKAKERGLAIPVVYNTNSYESVEALKVMDGLVDIYLPDFKYWNPIVAEKLSGVPKEKPYTDFAKDALLEMKRQVGNLVVENKIAKKGLLIRHLVLPGGLAGSKEMFQWIRQNLGTETFISLMSQYYPVHMANTIPLLRRKIRQGEYDTVVDYLAKEGFENVFLQETTSAPLFVPDFDEPEPFKHGDEKE